RPPSPRPRSPGPGPAPGCDQGPAVAVPARRCWLSRSWPPPLHHHHWLDPGRRRRVEAERATGEHAGEWTGERAEERGQGTVLARHAALAAGAHRTGSAARRVRLV